jgi:hypothetical protein
MLGSESQSCRLPALPPPLTLPPRLPEPKSEPGANMDGRRATALRRDELLLPGEEGVESGTGLGESMRVCERCARRGAARGPPGTMAAAPVTMGV